MPPARRRGKRPGRLGGGGRSGPAGWAEEGGAARPAGRRREERQMREERASADARGALRGVDQTKVALRRNRFRPEISHLPHLLAALS